MSYLFLKYVHIIGATLLLGAGAGIAFFLLMAHRSGDAAFIAKTAANVVIADMIFTASAVMVQPVTGYLLASELGLPVMRGWIGLSLILYVVTGLFWLPVVWMQTRMRDLAATAASTGAPLPDEYHRLFRLWFACGFPAFGAVMTIIWLMIAKPNW